MKQPRTCIVTGEELPKEQLVRFVVSPDGVLVADLKEKLPGRGCWVTASAEMLEQAIGKKLFPRSLKSAVKIPDKLTETIIARLEDDYYHWLSLARKAGAIQMGFEQVEETLQKGKAFLLLIASDAGSDADKISRFTQEVPTLPIPDRIRAGQAVGRAQAVYLAVTNPDFAEKIKENMRRLAGFVKKDGL